MKKSLLGSLMIEELKRQLAAESHRLADLIDIAPVQSPTIHRPTIWVAVDGAGDRVGLVFRKVNFWATFDPGLILSCCAHTLSQHVETLRAEENITTAQALGIYDGDTCDSCFRGWDDAAGHCWELPV